MSLNLTSLIGGVGWVETLIVTMSFYFFFILKSSPKLSWIHNYKLTLTIQVPTMEHTLQLVWHFEVASRWIQNLRNGLGLEKKFNGNVNL